MHLVACRLALAVVLLLAPPAIVVAGAQASVEYVPPRSPMHQPLHDRLRSERWLERMQSVQRAFRLPRPVTLKIDTCGEVDAWYERRTVAICYEYLQVVIRRIESGLLPAWVTPDEALAGAFVDAILHEFSHALIEQHRLPVLGREEEAADQMSAFLMLHLAGDEAVGLIRGTAQLYLAWMDFFQSRPDRRLATGAGNREARAHPTAAQRLYNLVCMAHGSDASRYAALAKAVDLPEERAEDCAGEHAQVARAFRVLILPHLVKANEADARRQLRSFAGPSASPR
jgi:hypothetical protein